MMPSYRYERTKTTYHGWLPTAKTPMDSGAGPIRLRVSCNSIPTFDNYSGAMLVLKRTLPYKETTTVNRLKKEAVKTWFGK
ncbi:MAG: hypothetical protein AB7E36_01015 [Salinivirgaceae bacterium]